MRFKKMEQKKKKKKPMITILNCQQTNSYKRGRGLLQVCLVGSHQNRLLFKHFCELSILVHRHKDIATANKLLVQIQLRDRRPVRVFFDAW